MLHLRVLGALDLHDDAGRDLGAVLSQPKRLALLAYLAVRPSGSYCRRDTLVAAFWPESDAEHARTALRGALHFLRRTLGGDAIRGRGDGDIGIDAAYLRCDAAAFADAVEAGRPDEALALYRGDLLGGFYVPDAPGFERWLDEERSRLRRMAADAAVRLADESNARADLPAAMRAAWRGAEIAPDDETVVRRLLVLLDRTGDRAGALRTYEALVARLAAEYDTAPSPETRALIDTIRRREDADETHHAPRPRPEAAASSPAIAPPRARAPDEGATAAPTRRRSRRRMLVALAAGIVAVGLGAWLATTSAPAATPASVDVLAVLPFTYDGSPTLAYLGDGLPRLVSANLNGAGQLRTIDPVALQRALAREAPNTAAMRGVPARFGAGLVVTGQVVESGGRVRITADVTRPSAPPGAAPEQIVVDGRSDRVFELVDALTARLVAAWGTERGQRLTSLAARTTPSLPALHAYLDGEREYAAGRYGAAVDAFQRAVQADSEFALAYYRLSSALTWTSNPSTYIATARARRFIGRLSHRDSLLVEARYANSMGQPEVAEPLYRAVLTDYPDEVEAWYQLGEVQYHWSALSGRPASTAEPAFARTVALDPTHVPALVHLARLAAADGRTARLDSLRERVAHLATGPEEALELDALHALTVGDAAERAAVAARFAAGGIRTLRLLPAIVASTENPGAALPAVDALGAAGTGARVDAPLLAAQLELARGRWRAASAALDRVADVDPALGAQYRAAFAAPAFVPVGDAELAAARAALAAARVASGPAGVLGATEPPGGGLFSGRRAYLTARLAVRAGDTAAARRAFVGLPPVRVPTDTPWAVLLARHAEAEIAGRAGRAADALRTLGPARLPLDRRLPRLASFVTADERFLRAELLRAAGRDDEALAWYATFPDPSGYDLIYLAPAHLAQAQILERREARAAAASHYRRFVALWAECDPALRPLVDEARRRLAALGG